MTYDQWKCTDPNDRAYFDEDDYDQERECDHDDYEIDILEGRARCNRCDYSWWVSSHEINREIERQARYQEDMDRMSRRQWWRDRTYPVRMFVHRVLSRVWPRKACSVLSDDEIPF